ncbi:MAG: cell division protein FtsK, partial [Planctomycetes bacterium]|nr:cell division protein FtsK [Planctomycetota bacterium]
EQEYAQAVAENDRQHQKDFDDLAGTWRSGIGRFQTTIEEVHGQCDRWFPDWNLTDWSRREPSAETPPAFRIGHYAIGLEQIEGGVPDDERLRPEQTEFQLPALLPFPDRSLLLLQSRGGGRERGIELIQSAMLRMLTSMPSGKVRFTIIDPVGLGENFSVFMHLSDYQEQLVSSRIWTDPTHIEQRLTDLAEHMENVIQVYLRNEFETILQYNDFAGEMAEPYRVLVIANFPTNFTQTAIQKLKSIVTSGARCGVFTLLAVDRLPAKPRTFELTDLAPHALWLNWRDGQFVSEHPSYGFVPLVFDDLPDTDRFTQMVRAVGSRIHDAGRVEVPFECVLPEPDQWWSADSRAGLDVPLGRAGARKLQHLSLGQGTSHHVLVAGKTGSGKSNLMHALIINLALRYSPHELELYLVDFKKGVEFKAYGNGQLPHARVVAIESEREFGLSVLARLDDELRRRGDSFRKSGVQDLKAYRASAPDVKLPRIVLIVDEFQELFVEDDRIAQDAALHLDRLVRQGRAFGIHVFLGSQTLSGAYSLARSTIGQMAVRIALQCSESDAHLILSEENTAARLLTRPGEAIYNDANGLYEGNHPFQVVWLPDQERDEYLKRLDELSKSRRLATRPPIVFEGNVPADPGENPLLADLLSSPSWPDGLSAARAWLGAPVAIKGPTAAEFVRQGASNLLVVGHDEEAALGVLATCLISLAAQHSPVGRDAGSPGARFYILNGMRPDSPATELWKRLAVVLPHEVQIVQPRGAPAVMQEVAEELGRRRQNDETDTPPLYLFVDQLSRFRDLRKADDDFGFSSMGEDKPPSPAAQFADVLREGPEFGIHSILCCDTYNSVTRSIDRQGLRDLEMRVLFQMNASDSSNLIDSPAAARLGVHRAVLYDEGQGRLEKFRPYGVPSEQWLRQVGEQLGRRVDHKS